MTEAREAKNDLKRRLSAVPGVAGIGIGLNKKGQPCVRVNVLPTISKDARDAIPSAVGTVSVEIRILRKASLI